MTFSIIIPFYNLEQYVAECLESVCVQTYNDFEVVCVDDGSRDKTADLLDDYARRDSRIRVVHKPNGGEGSARNAGLEVSRGRWICYLDGDDVWAPTFLADIVAGISASPMADMVSVRQWDFKDGDPISPPQHLSTRVIYDTSRSLSADLFMIGVWSTAYRSSVYGDLRFTAHCIGADRVYTMKCLARSKCAVVMAAQDYGYRIRSNSMAHGLWGYKKIASCVDFSRICVDVLAHSGKMLDAATKRRMASTWLEQTPAIILKHKTRGDRLRLIAEWRAGMRGADSQVRRFLPLWFRITSTFFNSILPAWLTIRIFCTAPSWLKRRGAHR